MAAKKKTDHAKLSRETEWWLAFGAGAIFVGLSILLSQTVGLLLNVNLTQPYIDGALGGNSVSLLMLEVSLYVIDALVALMATVLTVALLTALISRIGRRVPWAEARNAMGIAGGFMIALTLLSRLISGYIPGYGVSAVGVGILLASFLGACFAFAIAWETAGETLAGAGKKVAARRPVSRKKAA